MLNVQKISSAVDTLLKPRHGVPCFATNPNFDFKDRTVVVLGNSPALNHVDLTRLKSVTTFGVNRVFRAIKPDLYLFTDPPILNSERSAIEAFDGPLFIWQNYEKSSVHDKPNTRFFLLSSVSDPALWVWPKKMSDPLIRQGTTTAYCIQLAILGGARAVGILGIDFSAPQIQSTGDTTTHFYGNGVSMQSTGGGGWLPHHAAFYSKIPAWAAQFGVQVYNLSPYKNTPIHNAQWPKMSLDDFSYKFSDPLKKVQNQ